MCACVCTTTVAAVPSDPSVISIAGYVVELCLVVSVVFAAAVAAAIADPFTKEVNRAPILLLMLGRYASARSRGPTAAGEHAVPEVGRTTLLPRPSVQRYRSRAVA